MTRRGPMPNAPRRWLCAACALTLLVSLCEPAAGQNAGAAAAPAPQLNGANTWTGQQRFAVDFPATTFPIIAGTKGDGIVGSRTQTMLQIVGVANPAVSPEVNVVDAFAYNGFAAYNAERYNRGGPNNGAVLSGEPIGYYGFDPYDGISDANTAGMGAVATETQSHDDHHGTDLFFVYTPNNAGPRKRVMGLAISPGGTGGVTVGSPAGGKNGDLGPGTLNVQDTVATGNHYRSTGAAPGLSACGAGAAVLHGDDVAGAVATGAGTSSCTINFARPYGGAPICMVQTYASATPAAYLTSYSPTSITVRWNTPYKGAFMYMCQEVG